MTGNPDPPANPEEGNPISSAMRSADLGFGTPTGMVALGGLVLIGTYLVFGLLLNDYWVGWLALLLAISAVLLQRMDGTFVEKVAPVPVLTKVIGYLLGIIGVFAVLEGLRFADGTLNEFPDVLGALASYAGYAIAFIGARSIKV